MKLRFVNPEQENIALFFNADGTARMGCHPAYIFL